MIYGAQLSLSEEIASEPGTCELHVEIDAGARARRSAPYSLAGAELLTPVFPPP